MDIEISPDDVKKKLDRNEDFLLLDVREQWEYDLVHIESKQTRLMPIMRIPDRLTELPKNKEIITYCHHGNRSRQAALFLRSNGFRVRSMKGGLEEWSAKIDNNVPRYYQ